MSKQAKKNGTDIYPPTGIGTDALKDIKSPMRVGNAVVVMTVTLFYVGVIAHVDENELVLANTAIIPEVNGMRNTFLGREKLLAESMPSDGACSLNRGSVVAVFDWNNNLPVAKD